jgi:hypothetical protein
VLGADQDGDVEVGHAAPLPGGGAVTRSGSFGRDAAIGSRARPEAARRSRRGGSSAGRWGSAEAATSLVAHATQGQTARTVQACESRLTFPAGSPWRSRGRVRSGPATVGAPDGGGGGAGVLVAVVPSRGTCRAAPTRCWARRPPPSARTPKGCRSTRPASPWRSTRSRERRWQALTARRAEQPVPAPQGRRARHGRCRRRAASGTSGGTTGGAAGAPAPGCQGRPGRPQQVRQGRQAAAGRHALEPACVPRFTGDNGGATYQGVHGQDRQGPALPPKSNAQVDAHPAHAGPGLSNEEESRR